MAAFEKSAAKGNHGDAGTRDILDILRPEFKRSVVQHRNSDVISENLHSLRFCIHGTETEHPHGAERVQPTINKDPRKRTKVRVFPEVSVPETPNETPQQKALHRLRSRLSNCKGHKVYGPIVEKKDEELILWLQVNDLNVYMAECKLKQHMDFRCQEKVDTILTDYTPPNVLAFHYTGGLCGKALDDSLVLYELFGRLEMRQLAASASREEIRRFYLYRWENIRRQVNKVRGSKILMIVDMEGVNKRTLSGCVLQIWREVLQLFQDNYMWLVKEIVVLKRHAISQEVYVALRPYISRNLMAKVTVLGQNFQKFLFEKIARHEIPAFLGGYKCDVDNNPLCKQDLNWNYQVPGWTQITNPFQTAEVQQLEILGGEQLSTDFNVALPQSRMVWQFLSLSQPIEVSLYLDDVDDKKRLQKQYISSNRRKDDIGSWLEMDIAGAGRLALDRASFRERVLGGYVPMKLWTEGFAVAVRSNPDDFNLPKEIVCKRAGRYILVFDNWRYLGSKFTGVLKVLLSSANYITSKYAAQIPLGMEFDLSKPIGLEERKLRKMNNME